MPKVLLIAIGTALCSASAILVCLNVAVKLFWPQGMNAKILAPSVQEGRPSEVARPRPTGEAAGVTLSVIGRRTEIPQGILDEVTRAALSERQIAAVKAYRSTEHQGREQKLGQGKNAESAEGALIGPHTQDLLGPQGVRWN